MIFWPATPLSLPPPPYSHQTPVAARVATVAERHTPTEMEMETERGRERDSRQSAAPTYSFRIGSLRYGSVQFWALCMPGISGERPTVHSP